MYPLTPRQEISPNAMLVWASQMPTLLLLWICEWFTFTVAYVHYPTLLENCCIRLNRDDRFNLMCMFFYDNSGMTREISWVHHTTTLSALSQVLQLGLRWTTASPPMRTPSPLVLSTVWILWPVWSQGLTIMARPVLWFNMSGARSPFSQFQEKLTLNLLTRVPSLDLLWLSSLRLFVFKALLQFEDLFCGVFCTVKINLGVASTFASSF